MNALSLLAAVSLCALVSGRARAADPAPVPAPQAAPEAAPDAAPEPEHRTVITPTRRAANDFDVDRSVWVLDADDLARLQPADAGEALGAAPGVQVQRTNRGAGTPILRGLIGPQTLLLVDGVRFNTALFRTGPNQYASLIDPLALDGLEIVLGPASVLYGSDAMGGAVRYRPRAVPTRDGLAGHALVRFASVDLASTLAAGLSGRQGSVAGWAGASLQSHDQLRVGGGDLAPQSAFSRYDWRGKLQADLGDGWSLAATVLGDRTVGATRTDQVGLADLRTTDNADDLAWLTLHKRGRGLLRHAEVTLSYHRLLERVDRASCERGADGLVASLPGCLDRDVSQLTGRQLLRDQVHAAGLTSAFHLSLLEDRLRITAGLDADLQFVSSSKRKGRAADFFALGPAGRGTFSDGSRWFQLGAYAYAEGRPYVDAGTLEIVVAGGSRLTYVGAHAPDVPGLGDVDHELVGDTMTLGARAIIGNRLNVYLNWSQGFRAPNLQESTALGDTGSTFELPNDALGPEHANSVELGAKWVHPVLRGGLAGFVSLVDDAIVRESATFEDRAEVDGKPVYRRVNATAARYYGLELSLATGRLHGASLFGDVAWLLGEVEDAAGQVTPARRVPPAQGTVGVRWDWDRLDLYWSLSARWAAAQDRLARGDQRDLRICGDPSRPGALLADCTSAPGWATLDLRVGLSPAPGWRLDAALTNLLDARYRWFGSGIDAPGLGATVTASYGLL